MSTPPKIFVAGHRGMTIRWEGEGLKEKGYWKTAQGERVIVAVDPCYFRPAEVQTLLGDPIKAKKCWAGCLAHHSTSWCLKWCERT